MRTHDFSGAVVAWVDPDEDVAGGLVLAHFAGPLPLPPAAAINSTQLKILIA